MKNILITGGSGFLGRALVKRMLRDKLADKVCVYSRDEAKHAALKSEVNNNDRVRYLLGDVRDQHRLERACRGVDLVIHCAALKRIEVGVYNPDEMTITNVIGSQNVVNAVLATGGKAILVSSDKACEPISPYGYTKAIAEAVFFAGGSRFKVVRYGNVAGSTGSIIPLWRKLISERRPITITNPDATRFWMTVDQAVDLVLSAIDIVSTEPITPNLPAYRLEELADALGAENRVVVGMPIWEKMHESMIPGEPSNLAPRLSVADLKGRLEHV